jgi:hypothetical protein
MISKMRIIRVKTYFQLNTVSTTKNRPQHDATEYGTVTFFRSNKNFLHTFSLVGRYHAPEKFRAREHLTYL